MAPRKKATGGKFKKGESGNPQGSSARSRNRQLKAIARLTADQVSEVGTLILTNNRDQLRELAQDENASVLTVWMSGLIVRSMSKGDPSIFRAIMDRVVGRALERTEITGRDGGALALDVAGKPMTEEEIVQRIEHLAEQRRLAKND